MKIVIGKKGAEIMQLNDADKFSLFRQILQSNFAWRQNSNNMCKPHERNIIQIHITETKLNCGAFVSSKNLFCSKEDEVNEMVISIDSCIFWGRHGEVFWFNKTLSTVKLCFEKIDLPYGISLSGIFSSLI